MPTSPGCRAGSSAGSPGRRPTRRRSPGRRPWPRTKQSPQCAGASGRFSRCRIRRCRKCVTPVGRKRRSIALSWRSWSSTLSRRRRRPTGRPCSGGCRSTWSVCRRRPRRSTRFWRTIRPTPCGAWSIGCWRRPTMANVGAGTGSTWPALPTPRGTCNSRGATIPGRSPIATMSFGRSTKTCPTTGSSSSRSPPTSCRWAMTSGRSRGWDF